MLIEHFGGAWKWTPTSRIDRKICICLPMMMENSSTSSEIPQWKIAGLLPQIWFLSRLSARLVVYLAGTLGLRDARHRRASDMLPNQQNNRFAKLYKIDSAPSSPCGRASAWEHLRAFGHRRVSAIERLNISDHRICQQQLRELVDNYIIVFFRDVCVLPEMQNTCSQIKLRNLDSGLQF